jgi:hypothetical protein
MLFVCILDIFWKKLSIFLLWQCLAVHQYLKKMCPKKVEKPQILKIIGQAVEVMQNFF